MVADASDLGHGKRGDRWLADGIIIDETQSELAIIAQRLAHPVLIPPGIV